MVGQYRYIAGLELPTAACKSGKLSRSNNARSSISRSTHIDTSGKPEADSTANQVHSQTLHPADVRLRRSASIMISDAELYRLAIFLGSAAMVLIILYSFFEVNSKENARETLNEKAPAKTK